MIALRCVALRCAALLDFRDFSFKHAERRTREEKKGEKKEKRARDGERSEERYLRPGRVTNRRYTPPQSRHLVALLQFGNPGDVKGKRTTQQAVDTTRHLTHVPQNKG